eukprot:5339667-Alexandrium_andersonii.AAC.1
MASCSGSTVFEIAVLLVEASVADCQGRGVRNLRVLIGHVGHCWGAHLLVLRSGWCGMVWCGVVMA